MRIWGGCQREDLGDGGDTVVTAVDAEHGVEAMSVRCRHS